MCGLWTVTDWAFKIYIVAMLVYAVVSWVPSIRGRWTDYVAMIVEPVLIPVRQIIPPLGGIDLSFLLVIIVLQLVDQSIVGRQEALACLRY